MMRECRRTLDGGMSVMMFPEGTRSPDGALLPFKPGAFDLAIAAGVPILPVAIDGTRACRPKGSKWFGEAHAVARVLAPIPTTGLVPAEARDLAERTRATIAASLGRDLAAAKPASPPTVTAS
jgi:1-acyl-sn-glycerol-3-phosphate acyltransferase